MAAIAICAQACAQPDGYDFDLATIGVPGNAPIDLGPNSLVTGRGSVGYAYRISRLEITSAQWMEFVNTFGPLNDPFNFGAVWDSGFGRDAHYPGPGVRYELRDFPGAAMHPVSGIPFRHAAMYCNWLHNGKDATLAALASGAYDTSTWGDNPNGTVTDEPTHMPGAKYWIPTWDEWLKAAHFDPNRYGPGQGGYWRFVNSSDLPLTPGMPGEGQTGAGIPGVYYGIPLGAYPDQRSPWGLVDLSGGEAEWTESMYMPGFAYARFLEGSRVGPLTDHDRDDIEWFGMESARLRFGSFRIASSVPGLPSSSALAILLMSAVRRRRP